MRMKHRMKNINIEDVGERKYKTARRKILELIVKHSTDR